MRKVKEEPKVKNIDIKRGIPTLHISCKDCYFLKNAGAYRDDKSALRPCEYFGTVAQSEPCKFFVPNTRALPMHIGPMLSMLAKLGSPDIVVSAFFSSRRLKSTKFKIGEKIFFHVLGEDYLNNYASGYIIGYVQGVLIVEGNEGHVSQIQPTSALNEESWDRKLAELLKSNRINDIKGLHKIFNGKDVQLRRYMPPMLSNKKKFKVAKKKEKLPKIINLR